MSQIPRMDCQLMNSGSPRPARRANAPRTSASTTPTTYSAKIFFGPAHAISAAASFRISMTRTTTTAYEGRYAPPLMPDEPRILLVEDDVEMRHALTGILVDEGFRVTPVADLAGAVES